MPMPLSLVLLFPLALGQNGGNAVWPPAVPVVEAPADKPLELPPSIQVEALEAGRFRVAFRLRAPRPDSVGALVGSFNGWDANSHPLFREGKFLVAELELPEGRYSYKFALDGRWIADPENPQGEPDGYGAKNSLLALGAFAGGALGEAQLLDGKISRAGLAHDPSQAVFVQRFGEQGALLRYRTQLGDVAEVSLVTAAGTRLPMQLGLAAAPLQWWELELPQGLDAPDYTFLLEDGAGARRHPLLFDSRVWPPAPRSTPEWAKQAIWYQIMVDRFDNGNPGNDPSGALAWKSSWFKPSPEEKRSGESFYRFYVFRRLYGGDLAGLDQRLDYLADLGVNALYLNPVFEADTHHKYNATNYLHIDEHFGSKGDYPPAEAQEDLLDPSTWIWTASDQRFLEFVRDAKARGLRVVIDGVWNHVGILHPAFQDVVKNGRASRFADWFDVTSWEPFKYEGWGGYGELPAFKKTATGLYSESLKRHLFEVTRRWMDPNGDGDPSDGVDGWRLDVPSEIPMPFWVEWSQHVRSINPDAYLSGEIWDQADAWLDGRSFDAVMNYPFARVVYRWLAPHRQPLLPSEVDLRLAELRQAYAPEYTRVLMNLVDSHDTDRIVSMLSNPDRGYDQENREQEAAPYDGSKPPPEAYARARLAALLQMTYVGAPMVYYGDEVGMWGSDDPNNRRPMVWKDLGRYADKDNQVMQAHLDFYKAAIHLRRDHPALVSGSFRTLLTDDKNNLWIFLREDPAEQVLVALNASGRERTVSLQANALAGLDAGAFKVLLGDRGAVRSTSGGVLTLRLGPLSGLVLGSRGEQ